MSIRPARHLASGGAFALIVALAPSLGAQEAPRPVAPASPPPAAPAPAPAVTVTAPPANAVALCNDQSFIIAPALPSACTARGGLKLVLPTYRPAPPSAAAPQTASVRAPEPVRDDTPPAGATMRCKDGTWLAGEAAAARCAANGGLATILPVRAAPPPPPPRPPSP